MSTRNDHNNNDHIHIHKHNHTHNNNNTGDKKGDFKNTNTCNDTQKSILKLNLTKYDSDLSTCESDGSVSSFTISTSTNTITSTSTNIITPTSSLSLSPMPMSMSNSMSSNSPQQSSKDLDNEDSSELDPIHLTNCNTCTEPNENGLNNLRGTIPHDHSADSADSDDTNDHDDHDDHDDEQTTNNINTNKALDTTSDESESISSDNVTRCTSPISIESKPISITSMTMTTPATPITPTVAMPISMPMSMPMSKLTKLPLVDNDIYPSLILTLSDKPIHKRTRSAPRLKNRSTSCTLNSTTSGSNSSSKNNSHDTDIHTTADILNLHNQSSPSSPIRRQINLSLSIPPKSPIPVAKDLLSKKSKQARQALKLQNEKLQLRLRTFRIQHKIRKQRKLEAKLKKRELRKIQREERRQAKLAKRSRIIVIPSNHKLKVLWDALTVLITIASALKLHSYIRDRSTYEYDAFLIFTNVWFGIDLLLNFITDHRTSDGTVMRTGREVWGRYLTTWFAVDALSLLPWERMFIRPIIIMQNRRNIFTKWFFRSKGVAKATRFIGSRKFLIKYFGKGLKQTKKVGVGANKLIRILIKYIPKYLLFYRNMKGVLLLKTLRQVHYLKKLSRGLNAKDDVHDDDEEDDDDIDEEEDDDMESVFSMEMDLLTDSCDVMHPGIGVENMEHRNDDSSMTNNDLRLTFSMDDKKISNYNNNNNNTNNDIDNHVKGRNQNDGYHYHSGGEHRKSNRSYYEQTWMNRRRTGSCSVVVE